jgi:hypothetical protein
MVTTAGSGYRWHNYIQTTGNALKCVQKLSFCLQFTLSNKATLISPRLSVITSPKVTLWLILYEYSFRKCKKVTVGVLVRKKDVTKPIIYCQTIDDATQ